MRRNTPEGRWRKLLAARRFNLFQDVHQANRFEVSWKRANGSYGRRRFVADSIERAVDLAPVVAGLEQEKPDAEGITLLEGFKQALAETKRGPRGRADWLYQQTRFLKWLTRTYPNLTHWHQITRRVVKDYLHTFSGRSPNHKRLTFQPIVQTMGYLEREYQMPNVTRKLGIGNSNVRATPAVFITDVVSMLDYLAEKHPRLEAGAALQGLAALRLTEALRLTWDKVDLEKGRIEVSGETKTSWSHRTIPVADRVLEALKRAKAMGSSERIVDPKAPVVVSPKGCSYLAGRDSHHNYSKDLRVAIRAWNAAVGWQVKDLRNAVPTALAMAGLASDASEQYMGHAPKGITARHYIPRLSAVTKGEEVAFEQAMQVFHTLVVDHVNRIAAGSEARILNFFERDSETAEAKEA